MLFSLFFHFFHFLVAGGWVLSKACREERGEVSMSNLIESPQFGLSALSLSEGLGHM